MEKLISLFASTEGLSDEQVEFLKYEYLHDDISRISVFRQPTKYTNHEISDGIIYLVQEQNLYNERSDFIRKGEHLSFKVLLITVDASGKKEVRLTLHQDRPWQRLKTPSIAEMKRWAKEGKNIIKYSHGGDYTYD